jgi:hypothetical protein
MRSFLPIALSFFPKSRVPSRRSAAFGSSWIADGASDAAAPPGCATIGAHLEGIGA